VVDGFSHVLVPVVGAAQLIFVRVEGAMPGVSRLMEFHEDSADQAQG
jgi:hypothetical protein